jgi:peptide-methionine (R)-S-oxide reductase
MKRTIQILLGVSICIASSACSRVHSGNLDAAQIRAKLDAIPLDRHVDLTNDEWQLIMSPEQFHVMRRAGTERPSQSGNALEHRKGTYVCSACGNPLYSAEHKFNSGTGWPSFSQTIRREAVHEVSASRIFGAEISCARCGSHLGHVFSDGPPPTGLRYCMNAVALKYREAL